MTHCQAEQEQFFSRWEWEKYASSKTAKDFYTRDPFVTNLNEVPLCATPCSMNVSLWLSNLRALCIIIPCVQASWDRRVGGEDTSIWLVEFYAPWCKV